MANQKNILIAGAGIAGPSLALLLARLGWKCTIVERAPNFRASGQQVDLEGPGLEVARLMGIEEAMKEYLVHDDGMKFIDDNGDIIASFPIGSTTGPAQWVKEIEILRQDLAAILYERTKNAVEYVFGDQIATLQQTESTVKVTFQNSRKEQEYDFVIAADGMRSRTRDLAFDASNSKIVSLNAYVAFLDIPWNESDGTWTQGHNEPGGRFVGLRPRKEQGKTGAYIAQISGDGEKIVRLSMEQQKQEIEKRFGDMHWEARRVLEEMKALDGDQFYLTEIAQVKSTSLAKGRVALLGDAGYAPSPVSGEGTSLALTGVYILAGCLSTYDGPEALSQYEKQVRPFVERSQKLPPGVPWIINPQTSTGIAIRDNLLWIGGLAVKYGVTSVLGKAGSFLSSLLASKQMKLPEYPALRPATTQIEQHS